MTKKLVPSLLGIVGLACATLVVLSSGIAEVKNVLANMSLVGLIGVSVLHFIPLSVGTIGWWYLFRSKDPSLALMMLVMWLRAGVNNLLPVARVGGEIIAVRVMTRNKIRRSSSIASTVIETTLSVIAVFVFVLLGLGALGWRLGANDMVTRILIGVLISLPVVGLLLVAQRVGIFGIITRLMAKISRDTWPNIAQEGIRIDRAIRTMWKRKNRIIICAICQFMSWALGSIEIWASARLIGHNVEMIDCMIIESLIQATSSAAFLVPGSLGVQEAAFVILGRWFGLSPEVATALALIRRCRDIIIYLPALLVWQAQEGKWWWSKSRGTGMHKPFFKKP